MPSENQHNPADLIFKNYFSCGFIPTRFKTCDSNLQSEMSCKLTPPFQTASQLIHRDGH